MQPDRAIAPLQSAPSAEMPPPCQPRVSFVTCPNDTMARLGAAISRPPRLSLFAGEGWIVPILFVGRAAPRIRLVSRRRAALLRIRRLIAARFVANSARLVRRRNIIVRPSSLHNHGLLLT